MPYKFHGMRPVKLVVDVRRGDNGRYIWIALEMRKGFFDSPGCYYLEFSKGFRQLLRVKAFWQFIKIVGARGHQNLWLVRWVVHGNAPFPEEIYFQGTRPVKHLQFKTIRYDCQKKPP